MISPDKMHALTPHEKQHYAENGYVLVKAVFSREEAAYLRTEVHDIAQRLLSNQADDVVNQGWSSGAKVTDLPRELLHCHNVQFHSQLSRVYWSIPA